MPDSGSGLFTDMEEYRTALPMRAELLVVRPSMFRAFLTTGTLPRIRVLRARERTSRVGYFCLPRTDLVVSFPTFRGSPMTYNGAELKWGQIVFHRSGECFHQRIGEGSGWGMISGSSAHLLTSSNVVLGRVPRKPDVSKIVTPKSSDHALLLRLHAQAGRVVEQNLSRLAHPEVARALEQELLLALLVCLNLGCSRRLPPARRHAADIMMEFEKGLAEMPDHMQTDAEIALAMHVSERALRTSAARILGMEPSMYARQRRLRGVDLVLRQGGASGAALEEAVRRYGFSGLEDFVGEYLTVYGEPPGILLQRGA